MFRNSLKTSLFLGLLSLLMVFMGYSFGGQNGLSSAFILSLIMNLGAYFFSDRLALAASQAKPLSRQQYPDIYQMVDSLSAQMNIPPPRLYLTPDLQPNAFATGRSPSHASVALTRGIIHQLQSDELRAVIAHELAHIRNGDILIASIAAVIASTVSYLSNFGLWHGSSNDEDRPHPIISMLSVFILPLVASLIQFAISRDREFTADHTAATTLGTGRHLASALVSIHRLAAVSPMDLNPAYASLYIANPFGGLGGSFINLFSTHPPVEERVKRLQNL